MIATQSKSLVLGIIYFTWMTLLASAKEYHVGKSGSDQNDGSAARPYQTISAAALVAQPGDVITVHEGIYRERVNPPRGGKSDKKRITYQAASGEKVEIEGSEVVTNWEKVQDDTWKVTLPNRFFGAFNPYADLIHGDWFLRKGRDHHTGAVYLNGNWLSEAAVLESVLKPTGTNALWFGRVDPETTTIWAQFKDVNPNEQLVEINVRQSVFYPDKPGRNYITVRGFTMRHAATPWAPPTAEQIGLIGTHWSKGWIIENNVISDSACVGVSLGKYGDEWDNKSESADAYNRTIQRALTNGWNKATVGHHVVRHNTISSCEQAGIVGSMGAVFSEITSNHIFNIWTKRQFNGAEMAGIKIHASIDVVIEHNWIHDAGRAMWMDWMAQGTRISANLCYSNSTDDLFLEVDHGPVLVDNNIFLSPTSLRICSQGGAFVHNLIAGKIYLNAYDKRQTPYHKEHSTAVAGLHDNPGGDDRYYNNLFMQSGDLSPYDTAKLPVWMGGNVFLAGAKASRCETDPLLKPDFDPAIHLVEMPDGLYLELMQDLDWRMERTRTVVTTKSLGKAAIPGLPYETPDGSSVRINTDYSGIARNAANPFPGPFENPASGKQLVRVWRSAAR